MARARQGAHQMMELALNRGQIIKDIAVIKLQVIHHQCIAVIVDKLRTLVEKGTVVLVRFHHKVAAATCT